MAARSCPAAIAAGRSRSRMCSRRSASIRSARSATPNCSRSSRRRVRRPGSCGAQFTANTMATVAEAIGLALPYSCGAPAPYEMRDRFNFASGEKVMELIAKNIRPRDIVTLKALENAAAVVSATGGSTNARAASAGDRARGGHQVRSVRRRRDLREDALHRRPQARRQICRQGHVRGRRHSAADEDAARSRLSAWRLHDRHRPHFGRKYGACSLERSARTWCVRPTSRSPRPAASSASRETLLPKARS